MAKKQAQEFENLSFEDSIKQLTEIVNKIEQGQVPLQTSIEQYEKGMALIKHCKNILNTAQQRIEKISKEQSADNQPSQ
jgi:exodeoxyribonuclease VII small subunit